MKKILAPTDFSKNSENAISYAIEIAEKNKSKLSLLNVYSVPILSTDESFDIDVESTVAIEEEIRQSKLAGLKEIIEKNKLQDYPHRCFVREGSVENEILKLIDAEEIDLVVMGTKGISAEKGLFMGSVTKVIMQHANCPVLAIPEDANFKGFSKIIYAVDLHDDETNIINILIDFGRNYNSQITLLHVNTKNENKKWNVESLISIIDKSDYENIRFLEIDADSIEEGIFRHSMADQADLLVITTHTISMVDRIFHKSLAKNLLLHSKIPLLIFKRKNYHTIFLV